MGVCSIKATEIRTISRALTRDKEAHLSVSALRRNACEGEDDSDAHDLFHRRSFLLEVGSCESAADDMPLISARLDAGQSAFVGGIRALFGSDIESKLQLFFNSF